MLTALTSYGTGCTAFGNALVPGRNTTRNAHCAPNVHMIVVIPNVHLNSKSACDGGIELTPFPDVQNKKQYIKALTKQIVSSCKKWLQLDTEM